MSASIRASGTASSSASWGDWLSRHSTAVAASVALVSAVAAAATLYRRRRRSRARPLRSTAPLTIVELAVYPIKSCRGISLERSPVGAAGLAFDRQWMLVDATTRVFVSQRECPQLARVETALDHAAGALIVRVPIQATTKAALFVSADASAKISAETDSSAAAASQYTSFSIPLASDETTGRQQPRVAVTVWKSQCVAVDEGDEAAVALSQWCGRPVRLVRMAPEFRRALSDKYHVREDDHTNFADGFPILVTTTGSLHAVSDAAAASSASASPVRSVQFRPNVIIATEHAWEEDDWHTLRITSSCSDVDKNSDATMELRLVKPCTRCEIPTIDPERGAFGVGGQPTGALMRLGRANENGTPLFGVNAIPVFVGPAVGTGAAAAVSASTGVASSPSASASASASDLVRSDNARAPARGNLCVGDVVTVVAYQS